MGLLHHISLHPERAESWAQLLLSLEPDDVLVLLDQAAADLSAVLSWQARSTVRVRWTVPQAALPAGIAAPTGIEAIADNQWWQLITEHAILLEWN